MKKAIRLPLFIFIILVMWVHKAISQTVSNGSFDGTTTGWTQSSGSSCTATAPGEVNNTEECYDANASSGCTNYSTCGTSCVANTSPNYVAEVDQGNSPSLCQSISGFTAGNTYTLYFDLSRRTNTAAGSKGAPATTSIQVCVGTTCTTITRTNTTFGFTTTSWTFTAPASGTLNLTITNNSTYSSGADNSNYGMIIGYIGFTAPTPVTLLNFTAVKNGSEADINWQTETEINNDYFIVQKSKNGIDFIGIENIKGAGNSQQPLSYETTDPSPYNGTSYYRLKQVDFDGKFTYSKVVAVQNDESEVNIYPNPNQGSFNISVSGEKLYDIEVADVEGGLIYKSSGNLNDGISEITGLNKGIYVVRVIGENTIVLRKLVVM